MTLQVMENETDSPFTNQFSVTHLLSMFSVTFFA